MQPSYALLPATSHPKAVGGMCYAIIKSSHQYAMPKSRFTSIGLKHQIIINQLGIRIQSSMGQNKLSQHAITQSQTRETDTSFFYFTLIVLQ